MSLVRLTSWAKQSRHRLGRHHRPSRQSRHMGIQHRRSRHMGKLHRPRFVGQPWLLVLERRRRRRRGRRRKRSVKRRNRWWKMFVIDFKKWLTYLNILAVWYFACLLTNWWWYRRMPFNLYSKQFRFCLCHCNWLNFVCTRNSKPRQN
jgi:hypothetical protein